MGQLSFEIDDDLLVDLKKKAFEAGFDCSDLVVYLIMQEYLDFYLSRG